MTAAARPVPPAPIPPGPVWVRAEWTRPAWFRSDWCSVRLPNGYRYPSPAGSVRFGPGSVAYVRAVAFAYSESTRMVQVRFLDYQGEGSVDSVSVRDVFPDDPTEPAPPAPEP